MTLHRHLMPRVKGHPTFKRVKKFLHELPCRIAYKFSVLVEQFFRIANIRFRLLHGRNVEEHERLAEVVVGTKSSHRPLRNTDHRAGLSDRKSTRLNSSHVKISYAVFCLK